jgi:hypothetical protein
VIHRVFREPVPAAAAMLREAWDKQYRCGPRHILGDNWTARAMGVYFDPLARGVAFQEAEEPIWRGAMQPQQGAIVVVTPDRVWPPHAERFLKDQQLSTIEVPYRRTWRSEKHVYRYYFIAPQSC